MSLPYYKRFPRDFLDGTIGLSLETKGAYAIILDLIYMRDGRLADDARYIAGQLGCSVRKWTVIRAELIARGKLICELGFISNFRADYLLEDTRKYQDKQAENRANPNKINALQTPKGDQSESDTDTEKKETAAVRASDGVVVHLHGGSGDDWPGGTALDHAVDLVKSVGSVRLDTTRRPGLIQTLGRLAAWRRDGASWNHDVLPVVTAMARKQGPPISSWKFFDGAIAQSIADNRHALTLPEARNASPSNDLRSDRKHAATLENYASHGAGAEQADDLMAARRDL